MNMLRKHIKVEPATYYQHCDKLGLMVWQDMPSVINRTKKQFVAPNGKDVVFTNEEKATYNRELKAMIDHLSFFPCIVAWVPFNEGWGQHDTKEVLHWVKKYDPTRLVDGPERLGGSRRWRHERSASISGAGNVPGDGGSRLRAGRVRRTRIAAQGTSLEREEQLGLSVVQERPTIFAKAIIS